MTGEIISHYKILEKLGEGGMGVVYKALDTTLDRHVAIKFLPPHLSTDEEATKRFIHEAKAASALDHPNIGTIHEVDKTQDGRTFIVMAHYEGETLRERINQGNISVDEATNIVSQIASGLARAHEKEIVHRDIKPSNIIITKRGEAKIIDFGLAKLAGKTKLTKEGTTLGTMAYMSPEQAKGEEVDHRSDIFSLGSVFYEMLAGEPPFKGEHEAAILYSIVHEEQKPFSAYGREIPRELERIVMRSLAKNPEERYQRSGDLLTDLKALQRTMETTALGHQAAISKKKTKRTLTVVGIVAVVVTALLIGRYMLFPPEVESIDSIAVLPFENLSGDPDQNYFVDGMQEALVTALAKIGDLKVISRTSVMRYRETDKSIPEIARELDVDALIEGSVMRVGEEVRITVQLIHGPKDEHLWADSYDRDLRNVLGMISEVAHSITNEINVVLTQGEEERVTRAPQVNPKAYEAYMKGQYHFGTITQTGRIKALEYYQEAIEIDSTFAPAWAGIAIVYNLIGGFGEERAGEMIAKAEAAALRAVELDEELSSGHTSLGWIRLFEWKWAEAKEELERALELSPNDPYAYHGLGDYLTAMGRAEEGYDLVVKGRDCDPFSPIAAVPVAAHLYMLQRHDEAIAEAERLLEFGSAFRAARGWIARSYWQKGLYEEYMEMRKQSGSVFYNKIMDAIESGYAHGGPKEAMRSAARKLEELSKSEYVAPLDIAAFYAAAEEIDTAFSWLEKAYEMRAPLLWHIKINHAFAPLRSDPRYKDLLRRMGLPVSQ